MFYEFQPNSGIKTKTELDMQNCVITGNKVQYSLKNGHIMQYEIDSNGEIVTTGKNANVVELTKYQLSVFDVLKGRDGNDADLKKDDLKDLSEEELLKLINEKIKDFSSFSAFAATIDKKSITIKFKNGKNQETKLQINFKSKFLSGVGRFFKNIFSSDKKSDLIPSIEVGNLEESPIKVDEKGETVDEGEKEVPKKN